MKIELYGQADKIYWIAIDDTFKYFRVTKEMPITGSIDRYLKWHPMIYSTSSVHDRAYDVKFIRTMTEDDLMLELL